MKGSQQELRIQQLSIIISTHHELLICVLFQIAGSIGVKGEIEVVKPFDECPVCGGELVEKEVEKLLKGEVNTAVVKVKAEVCLQCGGQLYPEATVCRFELIRQKLAREDVAEFQRLGRMYQVG